jgi:hypothetical protein
MKNLFLSFALTAICFSAVASNGMKPNFKAGKAMAAPYKRLVVYGNLKVVLVSADQQHVFIAPQSESAKVNTIYSKNELVLDGSSISELGQVTVRVPVNQLELLEIIGNATVLSENTLNISNLVVSMQGEGKIDIKNTGSIKVKSDAGYQFKTITQKGKVCIE